MAMNRVSRNDGPAALVMGVGFLAFALDDSESRQCGGGF
jgi:hypothetical protein